jgi:predicted PurR-regulated permease PerM
MGFQLTPRERRWFDAALALATIALFFVVLGFLGQVVALFSDLILVFFLAWLLAFVLSPAVTRLHDRVPVLSRTASVILIYLVIFGLLTFASIAVATLLVGSIGDFIAYLPRLRGDLPTLLAPVEARLRELGIGQVDLVAAANTVLDRLGASAEQLAAPLQALAVASAGAVGNLLLVVVLSLYMILDRDRLMAFLFRLVPAGRAEDARVLEAAVSRSFGGFIRGQVLIGLAYGAVAAATSLVLGLDFAPATTAAAAVLMAIPFFGPFVAWAPPILVAIVFAPQAIVPAAVVMGVGWLLVMNVLVPRLLSDALRIHPIVVLTSVLVGLKVAGIGGAVFGIPIAAVLSALFFHSLGRSMDAGRTADRAAAMVSAREGRDVRAPREPDPAVDADVEGSGPG